MRQPVPTPTAESRSETRQAQELLRAAEEELERAEKLLRDENRQEARLSFNRAVDILLGAAGGAEGHPEISSAFNEIVSRIHALELETYAATALEEPGEALWSEELNPDVVLSDVDEGAPAGAPLDSSPSPESFGMTIDYNPRVAGIIEMFRERRREWFEAAIRRSGRYLSFMQSVFREEGLPEELVYMAMVESAFKARAVSRAGARGVWQFIRGTGRLYGLRQDYWVDDRFDPEKSTRAAARHLKDLYAEFEDWNLVMAAYNGGPNRVKRAIARAGTRDFWKLARTRYLRRETKSYVPLILATIMIARDPIRYGFEVETDPPLHYDVVQIDSPLDITTAAECAGTSVSEMKLLNPELRRWVTPTNRSEYALRVPKSAGETFRSALAAIPPDRRVRFVIHTVRRGDTLSHIALQYRTSVSALVAANNIGRRSVIRPGQIITIPVPGGTPSRRLQSNQGSQLYVVRPGDTLSEIAQQHGVSLNELRRWNGLGRRSLIHPGDRIVVSEEAVPGPRGGVTYRVRRGDTLSRIAQRFAVSVQQLRRWNNLAHDTILAGESLEIYLENP